MINNWVEVLSGFAVGIVAGVLTFKWSKSAGSISAPSSSAPLSSWTGSKNMKMVIIVRTSLAMGKGKVAAQCAHAALGCYKSAVKTVPDIVRHWENDGQPKIVLKLDSDGEEGLVNLVQMAKSKGLPAKMIRDAGRTQIESGTATVAGIGPGPVKLIDEITSHLKLL